MIASLPELVVLGKQELPKPEKHPVQKIVEKLVHFRLEISLDDDSKNFDPGEWWASIMKTEFEFELKDMNKLSKVIGDFLKNLPKGTLGSSELISNDYADYGLPDYGLHGPQWRLYIPASVVISLSFFVLLYRLYYCLLF